MFELIGYLLIAIFGTLVVVLTFAGLILLRVLLWCSLFWLVGWAFPGTTADLMLAIGLPTWGFWQLGIPAAIIATVLNGFRGFTNEKTP